MNHIQQSYNVHALLQFVRMKKTLERVAEPGSFRVQPKQKSKTIADNEPHSCTSTENRANRAGTSPKKLDCAAGCKINPWEVVGAAFGSEESM